MRLQYVITNQDDEMIHELSIRTHSSVVAWTTRPENAKVYFTHREAFLDCLELDRGRHTLFISTIREDKARYYVGEEYTTLHRYPVFSRTLRPST